MKGYIPVTIMIIAALIIATPIVIIIVVCLWLMKGGDAS